MTDQQFRIENIADYLDTLDTIADWHWNEWGHHHPDGSRNEWAAGLRTRTNRTTIPMTFIALEADRDEVLGSITLIDNDMSTHPELSPWIAGVFVRADQRGRGVASALVRHAVNIAADLGVTRLYLHTESARPLYEGLGWEPIGEEDFEGELSTIMAIDI